MTSLASLSESFCVVDFNFYQGINGEIIIKELAICAPETRRHQLWVFREPYPQNQLSNSEQRVNKILHKQGVLFTWDEGDVAYFRLSKIVNSVTKEFSQVVTFGKRKSEFISEIINRSVRDISPEYLEIHKS